MTPNHQNNTNLADMVGAESVCAIPGNARLLSGGISEQATQASGVPRKRPSRMILSCRAAILPALLAILLLLLAMAPAQAAVFRVNAASTAASPDGQSWANAYRTIQSAVNAAATGDELWVAAGAYTAATTGTDPSVVVLKTGISLYGGFAGAETTREQRDWFGNTTIIDGSGTYRCVTAVDSTNEVDGFTLQYGYANPDGGGMYQGRAVHCILIGNTASNNGGGMYNVTAVNCVLQWGKAALGAGIHGGSAVHCSFFGNVASSDGGGMHGGTAVNSIFWENGPNDVLGTAVTYSCLTKPVSGQGNLSGDARMLNARTGDFRLQSDSPCIDTGNAAIVLGDDVLGTPRPQGASVDMGAHEYHGDRPKVLRVNTAATAKTTDGLTWATAFPSIQSAIDSGDADTEIWVAEGIYAALAGDAVAKLKSATHLYGGFAGTEDTVNKRDWTVHETIIDGGNSRRCISASNCSQLAFVEGFTLKKGNAYNGGGMTGAAAFNCIFKENSAVEGGGKYQGSATDCSFIANDASFKGGGMSAGMATNCKFTENTASEGGGMSAGMAVNCVFAGNTAEGDINGGGGMIGGHAINCTFTGNTATDRGAGMSFGTATNCILWGNNPVDSHGTLISYSCLSANTAHESPYIGEGNIFANPLFVNPWAGDFRLQADSPCIDTGSVSDAPSTDVLGRSRPQGKSVDMGAFEYFSGDDDAAVEASIIRVDATSLSSVPDGLTWETAFPTLQEAANHAGYGTEIWVAGGTYTADTASEVMLLLPGTYVYGGFAGVETSREQRDWTANATIINGQNERRCVTANNADLVDGFTLQYGKAQSGGGMYHGTASHCIFSENTVTHYGGGMSDGNALFCTFLGNSAARDGGGMFYGNATDCTFSENSADYGGGLCEGRAGSCTFTNNSASKGAGMYGGTAVSCVFTGNTAANGGGIDHGFANNCTLTGNTANEAGGGIASGYALNSIIWNNSPDDIAGTSPYFSCLTTAAVGAGNIAADPLFVNAAAGDYRLQPGSPCIDTGTADGAPATDMLGVTRPQGVGFDMGAYEYPQSAVEGEGEGEVTREGEGEVLHEGEGEVTHEGEGEVMPEGEGEVTHEGEGEMLAEGEGEVMPEGEVEGEPAPDLAAAAQALLDNLDTADASGDGALSFEEAVAQVAGLTQAQFSELDANADGQLSQEELEDYLGVGGCCGCRGCHKTKAPLDWFKNGLGDLFLAGLSLTLLLATARQRV